MPNICPVCTKPHRNGQNLIQCSTCNEWVHHKNRLNCSGITDIEFELHNNNESMIYECDSCTALLSLKTFAHLPEFESATFNEPSEPTLDIFTSAKANHKDFLDKCSKIEIFLNISDHIDEDILPTINSKYYNIDEFNSLEFDLPSSLKLAHVNIASLDCHIDDLRLVLSRLNYTFDIIGISEHKIKSAPFKNINLDGYNKFIFQPTKTTHGGTGFYIKEHINYVERKDIKLNSSGDFESNFVEIKFENNKNLLIGCVYRHPSSKISISKFSEEHLDPILSNIAKENKLCVLMGDFNVNLLKSDSNEEVSLFYNTLTSHHYSPFVLQPTRLQHKTLIDNIAFNSLEYSSNSGNLLIEIADHLFQFVILDGFVKELKPPKIDIFKRDFKMFNEREFKDEVIDKVDWNNICKLDQRDPDLSFNNFYDTLNHYLDEYAPFIKVTRKELELLQKPWITAEILSKCKCRDSKLKDIAKETDPQKINSLRSEYKKLRNEITLDKRNGKKEYFISYFKKNKQKSSDIWKGIRLLVNTKSPKSSNIKLMDDQNNLINDPKKIANIFNDHFSTVGAKVDRKIPRVPGSYKRYLTKKDSDNAPFLNPPHSFFLSPAVTPEVAKIIESLDLKKSTGPMSIPMYILKIYKDFFSFWLSQLVNLSFEVGLFPSMLKFARVIPFHKKESKLNYLNYRPISLLSVFSKIFEKLIYLRIYSFLTKNNLISNKQFGFRSCYSTNHALVSITERIKSLLDSTQFVCGIFIDLEKAFDTVNHDILCDKLNYYGLRGNVNKLIHSYLTNRKQIVSINEHKSESRDITCGVPQGSSLGPLLFLIYINDFRFCLSQTETGHFADDTYILFGNKKLKTIETVMNTELKRVSTWLCLNRLSLNEGKTELIIFHSKRNIPQTEFSIKLNGKKLTPVNSVKYLGLYIDKYLSWDTHIFFLSQKLSRANGILSKLRHNAPRNVCLNVYYALFYSHLIYGCNIWGITTDENLDKIVKLQNKCVRIITFSDYDSHANPLFIDLNFLKVHDVIKLQQLKLAYEYCNNLIPQDLRTFFNCCFETHTLTSLRSIQKGCLTIPTIKTEHSGNKSLKFQCATLWNHYMTKPIPLRAKPKTYEKDVIHNLDMELIFNVNQFLRTLKKHFYYMYTLID